MLGVPVAWVRLQGTNEWHHTSARYNITNYYDLETLQEHLDTPEGQEHLAQVKAEVAVDAVFDAMRTSMQRGERIELRGFGVFQVKPRKRGIGRNPRTGKEVRIPPGRTIRFKPGKELQNIGS